MLELKYNLMSSAVIGSHAGCDRVASWVGMPGNGEGIDQYWGHKWESQKDFPLRKNC